jgi:hypothetical protein
VRARALGGPDVGVSGVNLTLPIAYAPIASCDAQGQVVTTADFGPISTSTDLNALTAATKAAVLNNLGAGAKPSSITVVLTATTGAASVSANTGRRLEARARGSRRLATTDVVVKAKAQTVTATIIVNPASDADGKKAAAGLAQPLAVAGAKAPPALAQPVVFSNATASNVSSGKAVPPALASSVSTKPACGANLSVALANPGAAVKAVVARNQIAVAAQNAASKPSPSISSTPSALPSAPPASATASPGAQALPLTLRLSFTTAVDLTTAVARTALASALATSLTAAARAPVNASSVFITKIADAATGTVYYQRPGRLLAARALVLATAYAVSFTTLMTNATNAVRVANASSTSAFLAAFKTDTVTAFSAAAAAAGQAGAANPFTSMAAPTLVGPAPSAAPEPAACAGLVCGASDAIAALLELSAGAKGGIAAGVLVFVAIVTVLVYRSVKGKAAKKGAEVAPDAAMAVREVA